MSATMSGDTPCAQYISHISRFGPDNRPHDTSARLLGSAKYTITKNAKEHEKPLKHREVGPLKPARTVQKTVIPGTPETPQTPQGVTTL